MAKRRKLSELFTLIITFIDNEVKTFTSGITLTGSDKRAAYKSDWLPSGICEAIYIMKEKKIIFEEEDNSLSWYIRKKPPKNLSIRKRKYSSSDPQPVPGYEDGDNVYLGDFWFTPFDWVKRIKYLKKEIERLHAQGN